MATWKKVILSGSQAELNSLTLDTALSVGSGGTNLTSYTTGDIVYASSTNTLAKLGIGSTGEILTVSDGGVVEWAAGSAGDISLIQNSTNGGVGVTDGSGPTVTLALDFNDLASSAVDVTEDSIAFIDATNGTTKKESISDLVALQADTGLTAANGKFSVDYGSNADTAVQGNATATFTGTTNEITVSDTTAQAIGGNIALTIGLPDDVTIGQDLTITRDVQIGRNTVISGNLTVAGTASFQETQNLDVADRFIRMASGSTTVGDGGIVVQQDGPTQGEAFAYDAVVQRWSTTGSFDPSTEAYTPDSFMSLVIEGATGVNTPTAVVAKFQKKGNIFIGDNNDIFIYS